MGGGQLDASAKADRAAHEPSQSTLSRPSGEHPLRTTTLVELPFPSSQLSGQGNKHFWLVRPIINAHRAAAKEATEKAAPVVAEEGDIRVSVTFYPPSNRGDRVNYPNRMKPYWDGIADALCVNDRRFLPSYHFAEPVSNARVVVSIG